MSQGAYLAYFTDLTPKDSTKPNGVFEIALLTNLRITEPRHFSFDYQGRLFEFYTKFKEEADLWVASLSFLSKYKSREADFAKT
jgi:hypothetical protein